MWREFVEMRSIGIWMNMDEGLIRMEMVNIGHNVITGVKAAYQKGSVQT